MKLQHVVAALFALASVGAFLFVPARGDLYAVAFAFFAVLLFNPNAALDAMKAWRRRGEK
jgi:hypothetical protein